MVTLSVFVGILAAFFTKRLMLFHLKSGKIESFVMVQIAALLEILMIKSFHNKRLSKAFDKENKTEEAFILKMVPQ